MASQRDVKNRISSVQNIEKITRAMQMVAAARLRRAEQRIAALRPYAGAIRRMTKQAAEAAENVPSLPILNEHESMDTVGIMLVTGDRGLAGAFNSQIIRAGLRRAVELEHEGKNVVFFASGRRGVSTLKFRKRDPQGGGDAEPAAPAALIAALDTVTGPAYVIDHLWNALGWNGAATALFTGWLDGDHDRNLLHFIFLNPDARALIDGWEARARRVIAEFQGYSRTVGGKVLAARD